MKSVIMIKQLLLLLATLSVASRLANAKIQDEPIRINKDVYVMGTTFVTGEDKICNRREICLIYLIVLLRQ